jgi:hypothetical protein
LCIFENSANNILYNKKRFIMKKNRTNLYLLISLILASIVLISCTEKAALEPAAPDEPVVKEIESVVRFEGLSLRDTAGGTRIEQLYWGEKVVFLDELAKGSDDKEYVKLRRSNGKEGWSREPYIVRDAVPAAIIEDTVLYSSPDIGAVLTKTLKRGLIIAIDNSFTNPDFSLIQWWDPVADVIDGGYYIKNKVLTQSREDITVARLLYAASKEKDENRLTFLNTAFKEFPKSVFRIDVENALMGDEDTQQVEAPVSISVVDVSGTAVLNDSEVNVRSQPNLTSSVVDQLNAGDSVTLLQRSEMEITVDSMIAYWYKIQTPTGLKGWIYGYFLDLQ